MRYSLGICWMWSLGRKPGLLLTNLPELRHRLGPLQAQLVLLKHAPISAAAACTICFHLGRAYVCSDLELRCSSNASSDSNELGHVPHT